MSFWFYISARDLREPQVNYTCEKFYLYPQVILPKEAFTYGHPGIFTVYTKRNWSIFGKQDILV